MHSRGNFYYGMSTSDHLVKMSDTRFKFKIVTDHFEYCNTFQRQQGGERGTPDGVKF